MSDEKENAALDELDRLLAVLRDRLAKCNAADIPMVAKEIRGTIVQRRQWEGVDKDKGKR